MAAMSGPTQPEPPDDRAEAPGPRPPRRWDRLRRRSGRDVVEARERPRLLAPWLEWIRAQPVLAVAVLVFCVAALAGLVLTLPPGLLSAGRSTGGADPAPGSAAEPPPAESAPTSRASAPDQTPRGEETAPRPWQVNPASTPSPRGLALVYAYRALPPGGESRYEWFVRLEGPRALLEGIEVVRWRMDPPPKDGDGDLVSRDRAGDGFPLMGHGPGGWFGVSATVQFADGGAETLARRIALPE
jgi:hypothetical protein